jgi:alpha-1,3-fucosyltransferase
MEAPYKSVATKSLNGLFNLTMTHRMDSDVVFPYFYFTDNSMKIVSPSLDPEWRSPEYNSTEKYTAIHARKSKHAAWFVTNCQNKSGRNNRVRELQRHINVDVYGKCGPLSCPRTNEELCFQKLKREYYFYLAYENSLCIDYVTEKVVNAFRYETIPVILGGYNTTRFIPPGSYIDASQYSTEELAKLLKHLMENPKEYAKYFWWRDYYKTSLEFDITISPFCNLCKVLNDNTREPKVYDIAEWWHGSGSNLICNDVIDRPTLV